MYIAFAQILQLPPYATTKGVRTATKTNAKFTDVLTTKLIYPVIKILAPFIHIESFKVKRLKIQLDRAEISLTPKEYYARSIGMSAITLIVGGMLLTVAMRKLLPVVVILSLIVYFHFHGEVKDKLKVKDKQIESELPKFIRAIVQGLKTEKDVIKLLETYETIAGIGLKYDIEILIMDLKSGNFEDGMLEFDKRVGNAYVSRLAKALASVNRGDDQSSTLNHLLSDMALLAKETMQRELNKRPGKVKIMVIPIVVVGICTLFYVIGVHLINSLSGIM